MRHHLTEQAVLRMALQYRVSASEFRLQSQEFVACFLSNRTRLTNLGAILVPDFQGALRLFEQSLILAADRCVDAQWLAHFLPLHGRCALGSPTKLSRAFYGP